MADQKISELTALTGANVADDDAIAIVDTSATETKKIVFSELKNALDTATGFVRITGDTMTGALDVQSTITADGLTVDGVATLNRTNPILLLNETDTTNLNVGLNVSASTFNIGKYADAGNKVNDLLSIDVSTGDISFYEDTGTTPKFFWDASAESLGIGTTSPSAYGAGYTTVGVNGSTMSGVEGFVGGTLTSYTQTYAAQTLMGTKTATPLVFVTNDTPQMRITSSGSVGIGTSSIDNKVNIQESALAGRSASNGNTSMTIEHATDTGIQFFSATQTQLRFGDAASTGAGSIVYAHGDDSLRVSTNGSERMRIDSSGNVGIGTSSPSAPLEVTRSTAGIAQYITNTGSSQAYTAYGNSDNPPWSQDFNTAGGLLVGIDSDESGILFQGGNYDLRFGTNGTDRMRIDSSGNVGINESNPSFKLDVEQVGGDAIRINSGNDFSGLRLTSTAGEWSLRTSTADAMIFYDVSSASEAMRITSGGYLALGNTLIPTSGTAGVSLSPAGNVHCGVTGTSAADVARFDNANGRVGSITASGSSTSYNTSSDHRLKENVVELTGATERLKQLNPSRFNFIANANTTVDGFLAHEVQTVVPEAITGTHNEVDADGNPVYQGIDQSKLVPLLVATIKELEARITALENA